ncbi:MAG: outer membrane lipid asymmetry maintenance protein MlaD [Acetobacteraceae bacterium]
MPRRNLAELLTGAAVLAVALGFLIYALGHSGTRRIGASYVLHARFDNIAGLAVGAPVRLAGVPVGRVLSESIDPRNYLADVALSIENGIRLPKDSSASVASESLLGGEYLSIDPGASNTMLAPGQAITITQGAISLETLLGKFIFSATNMVSALGKAAPPAQGAGPGSPPGLK